MRKVSYATKNGTTWDMSALRPALMRSLALMSWEWDMDETGAAARKDADYKASVVFADQASYNAFLEGTYEDAEASLEGTLTVDGWSLSCAVKGGDAKRLGAGLIETELTFHSASPMWRKITTHRLAAASGDATTTTGLDIPTDYPFDLAGTSVASGLAGMMVDTPFLTRLTFFGVCQNPYATVTSRAADGTSQSNRFGVSSSAGLGERIVIDPLGMRTVGASVYKVGAYGERSNLFDARTRGVEGSGSYVFQKLPPGYVSVSWPQSEAVTLDVIEERGSLPWT